MRSRRPSPSRESTSSNRPTNTRTVLAGTGLTDSGKNGIHRRGRQEMLKAGCLLQTSEFRHVAIMARASSTYRPEATSILSKSWSMASAGRAETAAVRVALRRATRPPRDNPASRRGSRSSIAPGISSEPRFSQQHLAFGSQLHGDRHRRGGDAAIEQEFLVLIAARRVYAHRRGGGVPRGEVVVIAQAHGENRARARKKAHFIPANASVRLVWGRTTAGSTAVACGYHSVMTPFAKETLTETSVSRGL